MLGTQCEGYVALGQKRVIVVLVDFVVATFSVDCRRDCVGLGLPRDDVLVLTIAIAGQARSHEARV